MFAIFAQQRSCFLIAGGVQGLMDSYNNGAAADAFVFLLCWIKSPWLVPLIWTGTRRNAATCGADQVAQKDDLIHLISR